MGLALHRVTGEGRQINMANGTNEARVWFITGASTGFGRLLAEQVLKAGERVIATARKREHIADLTQAYPETARVFALDVTKPAQIEAVAKDAIAAFGRVDVLVNNAGYGIAGGIEEATEAEFLLVLQTNVLGLIRVTRAFLPQFRRQRSGNILMLSSVAGLIGGAGWGYYNTSKFAVEGFSEALAGEMAPLGVKVTIIEPGPFRTDFLGRSAAVIERVIPEYEGSGWSGAKLGCRAIGQRGDPLKAVQAMMEVVESPNPPLHLILGAVAYNRFKGKLEKWQEEMAKYEKVTLGADFPEGE